MRDRSLVQAALVGALVCCGAMALIAGLVSGVALVAIGRFIVVSIAGLAVVVAIAWWLGRRGPRHDRTRNVYDRSAHRAGTLR